MLISLIVAIAENNVIGYKQSLPWHLPADLAHFKKITLNKPIIMGRKTYESIGKALPYRRNIILSRNPYSDKDIEVFCSLDLALSHLKNEEEVLIIGGQLVFEEALPIATRIYLTEISASFTGDTFFPLLNKEQWVEKQRENFQADAKNPYKYSFVLLERRESVA